MKKFKLGLEIVIIGFVLLFFLCGLFGNSLKIRNYRITASKVSKKLKIGLLTDLHNSTFDNLLTLIHAEKPDVILLGGDIFDIRLDSLSTFNLLSELSQTYPTYFVTGNHEYDVDELEDLLNQLKAIGVRVLTNESVQLTDEIILHGVDDRLSQNKQVMVIPQNDKYNIVLVHRPHLFSQYVAQNVDLVLSGHVHGGQWAIPYLLNGLVAPDQGLFPKYAGGYYEQGNSKMIISRGLSRETDFIFRFYNPYELVMIEVDHE